jgi:hypothetical protein
MAPKIKNGGLNMPSNKCSECRNQGEYSFIEYFQRKEEEKGGSGVNAYLCESCLMLFKNNFPNAIVRKVSWAEHTKLISKKYSLAS